MFIDDFIKASLYRGSELDQITVKGLLNSTIFKIDNIAHYVHVNNVIKNHKTNLYRIEEHIPNIAPLAPIMWFEWNNSAINGNPHEHSGCNISIDYDRNAGIRMKKWKGIEIPQERRWIVRAEYFHIKHFTDSQIELSASDWIYYISIGESGQILSVNELENHRLPPGISEESERKKWHEEIIVALTAICFAHCKGTEIAEHQPSRQVRRQAERKKEPTYSYHTIDIHPSARVLKEEGDIEHNGLAKALHICRGNFAHYTAEKPLFGKYVGTVYRPMHVRGKAENGIVEKDYRVHAK